MTTSSPLLSTIVSILSDNKTPIEEKSKNVIVAVAMWIHESPLDVYTDDRMVIVNAVIDQAYSKSNHEATIDLIKDLVEDLDYWISLSKKPNFSADTTEGEINHSKTILAQARYYLTQQKQ